MINIPKTKRGRQTTAQQAERDAEILRLCDLIKRIQSTLEFTVSSRGWCYLLEEHGLNKGSFDTTQRIINDCRKNGLLPLDICAEDITRTTEGIQDPDNDNITDHAADWIDHVKNHVSTTYQPYHFTEYQDCYIEMGLEKIDLKGIFAPVCDKYHVPYYNMKGWSDINSRAAMMERFKYWESQGKHCVLLLCGDHDPGGLNITNFMRSNLADLSQAVQWNPGSLIIDRFGLNYDFIQSNNLTKIENLETSSGGHLDNPKHKDHYKPYVQNYLFSYGAWKVEANALVTRIEAGRNLCENAILKYINVDGFKQYLTDTAEARQSLQAEIITQMRQQ